MKFEIKNVNEFAAKVLTRDGALSGDEAAGNGVAEVTLQPGESAVIDFEGKVENAQFRRYVEGAVEAAAATDGGN